MVDVIVVGAGIAGLVAASEAVARGRRVLLLDQEGEQSLGGQAHWSMGGLFMVNSQEQKLMGIQDSRDLAEQDWMNSAGFDRPEDENPRKMAKAFLDFASGELRSWLFDLGLRWFPVVGWAERAGSATGHDGNSVPRFHVTWGAGPAILKPFIAKVRQAESEGMLQFGFRHRVRDLIVENGTVVGVTGVQLRPDVAARGAATSREAVGSFEYRAESVILTSGGIGGNTDLVRANWPTDRLGPAPRKMIVGVPAYVDGLMQQSAAEAGAHLINNDRMWNYPEGLHKWDGIWPGHAVRIVPGPSAMWFDATGQRLEPPCLPGFDTGASLARVLRDGHAHSWFILDQKILSKEIKLSGSAENPDLTSGNWANVIKSRAMGNAAPAPVEAFKKNGQDFLVADDLESLVAKMNLLAPDTPLDPAHIRAQVEARDAEVGKDHPEDDQVAAIQHEPGWSENKLVRSVESHRLLERGDNGSLVAIRLNFMTRKSLGGLHTDISGRVLRPDGSVFAGLYAAGEVAGFGAGGYHGYKALEGTFLGGCLFSGREAGRAA